MQRLDQLHIVSENVNGTFGKTGWLFLEKLIVQPLCVPTLGHPEKQKNYSHT